MEEDKISVIIPVYNTELYLRRCLESVINQTYTNLQIIIIDDGSTDNSLKICTEYAQNDNRLIVYSQNNRGVSAARNKGLDMATGDYIAFVDSDDFIENDMFAKLLNTMVNNEADIIVCGIKVYSETSESGHFIDKGCVVKNEILNRNEMFDKLIIDDFWHYVMTQVKLYKSQIFDNLRFTEEYIYEDEIIFHRIVDKCNKIVTIEDKMYCYRCNSESITKKGVSIRVMDKVKAFEDRLEYFDTNYKNDLIMEKMANNLWGTIITYFFKFDNSIENEKYLKRAYKSFRNSLKYLLKYVKCSKKEKMIMILFAINPSVCKKLLNK